MEIAQLRSLGLTARAVQKRAAVGRLHRVHRGVYAVGHPVLGSGGYAMAAVLACGPGAVLSHRSAAALWGIRPTSRARHEVTAPRGRTGPPGVEVHTARRLDPQDVTRHHGIPTTTVARTLVDLAGHLTLDALARALHESEVLRLFDGHAIEAALERAGGRPGIRKLRRALGEPEAGVIFSDLEWAFVRLCREAGLPPPVMNAQLDLDGRQIQVDALWPRHRVAIELDGGGTHHTRRAFHADRRRDSALAAHGFATARYTWHRVTRERRATAAELHRILAVRCSAPWSPSPSTSA